MTSNKISHLLLTIIIILHTRCDFDDTKYIDVCTGKYSVTKFKDSIAKRYMIRGQNIEFKQMRKMPIVREYSCDTIYLEISTDSIPIIFSDTFALIISKIFFSDTLNKDANSLDITLIGYWSVKFKANEGWGNDRRSFIKYRVDRDSIGHYDLSNELVEVDSMRYDIESERLFSYSVSDQTNEGLYLTLKVKKDYKNFVLLADQIRDKYYSVIDEKRISSFQIKMIVDSPSCRLCSSKSYEFRYDIMQYLRR
ncbi:MAG: hypothetical protein SFU87_10330 [Chitinophagaceae bacterium]|nr:hypothetical protein [Chitinophagaceae bacterium]